MWCTFQDIIEAAMRSILSCSLRVIKEPEAGDGEENWRRRFCGFTMFVLSHSFALLALQNNQVGGDRGDTEVYSWFAP